MEIRGGFRVIVFAFGQVGRQIVDFIALSCPGGLAKVIVDQDAEPQQFRDYCALLGPDTVMSWGQASSGDGLYVFKQVAADIAILAWWPHILDRLLIEGVARNAVLNLHPSLLPHCRGKDPYFWSIVERRPFGVTIHHVTENIDAGDIAYQQEIPLTWEDTAETLYRKAQLGVVQLLKASFERMASGDIPRLPQNLAAGSFHARRELDPASMIDLERQYSGREILDLLRARTFAPHPGCRFVDGGQTYQARLHISRIR